MEIEICDGITLALTEADIYFGNGFQWIVKTEEHL